jgi:hypothetical protein
MRGLFFRAFVGVVLVLISVVPASATSFLGSDGSDGEPQMVRKEDIH